MVRLFHERVLLIGDDDNRVANSLHQALPEAIVHSVASVFDGIAELCQHQYSAVLAHIEPMTRRADAAVKTLRESAGESRLLLFGDPSHEPLSQRMLQMGADDYLITPSTPRDLERALTGPLPERGSHATNGVTDSNGHTAAIEMDGGVAAISPPGTTVDGEPSSANGAGEAFNAADGGDAEAGFLADVSQAPADPRRDAEQTSAVPADPFANIALTQTLLDAMVQFPGQAFTQAIAQLNRLLPAKCELHLIKGSPAAAPAPPSSDAVTLSRPLVTSDGLAGIIELRTPTALLQPATQFIDQLAPALASTAALQERHRRLQRLAFTDDLTGIFNGRYFRHFLSQALSQAKRLRQPVTLFLFDIDNFKSYNDRFGHGVGDDILRETAALMRRCVRDHDLVARISGDEFAVVFWETSGPRVPRASRENSDTMQGPHGRPPQEPRQMLARFQRLLATQSFPKLGASGRGHLTISGGLAVYPYDAHDFNGLIAAADKALMFGAKRSGRDSIMLVGDERLAPAEAEPISDD